jgi:hypothetical protein
MHATQDYIAPDPRLGQNTTDSDIDRAANGEPEPVEPPEPNYDRHDAPRRNHLAVAVEELLSTRHRLSHLADKYVDRLGNILSDFAADLIARYDADEDFQCGTLGEISKRIVTMTREEKVVTKLAAIVAPTLLPTTLGSITGEAYSAGIADIEAPYSGEPGDVQSRRDV